MLDDTLDFETGEDCVRCSSSWDVSDDPECASLRWESSYLDRIDGAASDIPHIPLAVLEVIESSMTILELDDDWDGQGAGRYVFPTWERMACFLKRLATEMFEQYGVSISSPKIFPAGEGSIDIHWKTDTFELLINIPPEPEDTIRYYGDNKFGNTPIENSCYITHPDRKLLAWMSLFL